MNFDVSRATRWLWRHIRSHWACRIYLVILAIILISAVLFRVEAAIFQQRVDALMASLSSLRIGETSKAEALSLIPGLAKSSGARGECHAEECLSIEIQGSTISLWLLRLAGRTHHELPSSLLNWWGVRYWSLLSDVDFTSDRVSHLSYGVWLSTRRAPALSATVSLKSQISDRRLSDEVDESPNYVVGHTSNWPDSNRQVSLTRDAPPELAKHAFDIQLRCLSSLAGCETAAQLLPEVENDRLAIKRAALARLKGPEQCPMRILHRRVRDVEDILLVEVKDVDPKVYDTDGGPYRVASFRLLRVLKGNAGRPLDKVGVSTQINVSHLYPDNTPDIELRGLTVRNAAIDLLGPGLRVLLFSGGSTNIDESCEAMAATENAVDTIEAEFRSKG